MWYYACRLNSLHKATGIDLCPNVAGVGLHIPHGKVVINPKALIGEYCKIYSDVTIGVSGKYADTKAPVIGNRVVICTGARIIGNVHIADEVVIGANAVVVNDISEPGITVAGIPAKKVNDTGSYEYLYRE